MRSIFSMLLTLYFFALLTSGCSTIPEENKVPIKIIEAEASTALEIKSGTTVDQVLLSEGIHLGPLDRVEPSVTTFLLGGETIRIIRGIEEFAIVESTLPFEQQTVKNESLPEGQSVLIQSGVNGKSQTTYRILIEDGVEVSRTLMSTETIQPAKPEIMMIGVQSPFSSLPLLGSIAYISSSNAWVMDTTTSNRRILVSTGDLDGRVFTLSPDRQWLLFSRSSGDPAGEHINSLWLLDITKDELKPVDTKIRDVVHYADWVPGKRRTFAYSTVEPRTTAPGWQANNDLQIFQFDDEGKLVDNAVLIEVNSGGLYGWWGTIFQWSPDGSQVAYARPDAIGLVDTKKGEQTPLIEFTPYQPHTDWAWVPWVSWSEDNHVIYSVINSTNESEESYNLSAILVNDKRVIPLAEKSGLFTYPVPSPANEVGNYTVSFLSAIIPEQSETSRYNLNVMDRDGSNRKKLYPGEGLQGLDPQTICWSPGADENGDQWIAFIAQGNLLLVNTRQGTIKQVTGDGSITKLSWR